MLNILYQVFWIRHNIFPDILNIGVYEILFILTQNAYLYTPVFSYVLYITVYPLYLFVFHPRIKTFISYIQLCFTPISGLWKFNNSLVLNEDFLQQCTEYIQKFKLQLNHKLGFATKQNVKFYPSFYH